MLWDIIATALFLLAFGALALRWLAGCGLALPAPFSDPLPRRKGREAAKKELLWVFGAAILFRLVTALASLPLYNSATGSALALRDLPQLWCRWDAPHYAKLAELGYGGYLEDGQPLFLVFYPLYVWLVRAVRVLFAGNTALAGMTVSFACFAWGSTYLYRLACEEYGDRTARAGLLLLWCYPFSFFFGGIMTESLFLLTTSAALWHIRNHRWRRAGVWGALAALTRMQGVVLIGAAAAELCSCKRPFTLEKKERKGELLAILKTLPVLCIPVLGSLAYFLLNWHVAGDPFYFTVMQRHWHQGFLWFPEVLRYLAQNALAWADPVVRWEMWIPELVLFPLFAFILAVNWKRHRSMLTLYSFVYFILNYCLSWLLSAGRYLSCALPVFLFLAEDWREKPVRVVRLAAGMFLLQLVFLWRYLCWGQVM